ncbi:MAG: uroporphyrinogen-III synthase [Candidatus Syntrophoarchaeum caldarius]|uniref:Uroporphyrinogen-III synthase n=1 Tax=Candidatus Syntropharchaeum caldarium TaxID=1838285 RepID=A0A1F2PAA3_9EURY|nr:MAG: uroporphyrinogen-III synthase [Candidatus Syntrophoarchaeum caldarius]
MKIAITRPEEHLEESVELARSRGFEVIAAPMVAVCERDEPAFEAFYKRVIDGLTDFVILTSVNGVRFMLRKVGKDREAGFVSALNGSQIMVVSMGPRTAKGLERSGINPDLMPDKTYTSSGLVELLTPMVEGKTVEIVRSDHGSSVLTNELTRAGADLHEIKVYKIVRPVGDLQRDLIKAIADGKVDVATFTSAQTVKNFFETAEELGLKEKVCERLNEIIVAVIGEPTANVVEELGVKVDIMPERALFDAMIDEISERIGV